VWYLKRESQMRMNLSQADQLVRGIVGAGLIMVAGLGTLHGVWQALAVTLGSVGVFTASAGFCPLYHLLGLGRSQARAGDAAQPQ
jgi:hypothetical protein